MFNFDLFQSSKNDFRRKWDKDEYESLAQKRLVEERELEKRDGEENCLQHGFTSCFCLLIGSRVLISQRS